MSEGGMKMAISFLQTSLAPDIMSGVSAQQQQDYRMYGLYPNKVQARPLEDSPPPIKTKNKKLLLLEEM
jgi:hypothetical protein